MHNLKPYFLLLCCLWFGACNTSTTKEAITSTSEKMTVMPPAETAPALPALPSLKEKSILMIYGGWQGHKPKEYTEKISKFLRMSGAEVTISPSVAVYEDSTFLSTVDLIIQSVTMDKLTPAQAKGLLSAIKDGGIGFAGCHGGTGDAFRETTAFQYMVGGQFVGHPGGQVDYTVQITDPKDPVTAGIQNFAIHTEQYYMHIDPNVKVLATTQFSGEHDEWIEGATMPVAWKKYYGKGRVFYLSLGHHPELFDENPAAKTLLMQGFQWASGSKFEAKEQWLSPIYK